MLENYVPLFKARGTEFCPSVKCSIYMVLSLAEDDTYIPMALYHFLKLNSESGFKSPGQSNFEHYLEC